MLRLKPCELGHHITRIDFAAHAAAGRVHWIFDVDRTILPKGISEVAPEIITVLREARAAGHIQGLTLVSNVILKQWKPKLLVRLAEVARQLDVPATHVFAAGFIDQKPRRGIYRRAMAVMGSRPETTVMVGDQIFTDVWGANRLGIWSILVWPLGKEQAGAEGDHPLTALKRGPEAYLLRRWGFKRDG